MDFGIILHKWGGAFHWLESPVDGTASIILGIMERDKRSIEIAEEHYLDKNLVRAQAFTHALSVGENWARHDMETNTPITGRDGLDDFGDVSGYFLNNTAMAGGAFVGTRSLAQFGMRSNPFSSTRPTPPFGRKLGEGGSRVVYEHPTNPNLVIKVKKQPSPFEGVSRELRLAEKTLRKEGIRVASEKSYHDPKTQTGWSLQERGVPLPDENIYNPVTGKVLQFVETSNLEARAILNKMREIRSNTGIAYDAHSGNIVIGPDGKLMVIDAIK